MKKWDVTGVVSTSKDLGMVDADTAEEAVEKALRKAHVSVCYECGQGLGDFSIEDAFAYCEETDETYDSCDWRIAARVAGWQPPEKKAAKNDPLEWTAAEREGVARHLEAHASEPDRASLREEAGFDLVAKLGQLAEWLRKQAR